MGLGKYKYYLITSPRASQGTQNFEAQEPNPQVVVEQVQEPQESILRRSTKKSRQPTRYLGLHDVLVIANDEPLSIKDMMEKT